MPKKFGDDTETRNCHQCRQILWRQHELHRFEGHDLKSIDLFGHLHGANLGGKCRSRASADRDRRQQRTKFACEADCDQIDDEVQSSEPPQLRGSLHRQDESAAHRQQGNHRQRVNPDLEHLVNGCSPPMSISN